MEQSLAGNAETERAGGRHDFDVAAFPAHNQRNLDGVAGALGQLLKRNSDCKWILGVPARFGGRPGLRIDNPCHGHRGALRARRDANDVGRIESKLSEGGSRQGQLEVALTVDRGWSGAVEPELDILRLEFGARAGRVDPEIHLFLVVAIHDALDHAGRPVQRAES